MKRTAMQMTHTFAVSHASLGCNSMHKNIALLLGKIMDKSPYTFDYSITPRSCGGFWLIEISLARRDSPEQSLIDMIPYIGRVFGEELFIEDDGTKITVS